MYYEVLDINLYSFWFVLKSSLSFLNLQILDRQEFKNKPSYYKIYYQKIIKRMK